MVTIRPLFVNTDIPILYDIYVNGVWRGSRRHVTDARRAAHWFSDNEEAKANAAVETGAQNGN